MINTTPSSRLRIAAAALLLLAAAGAQAQYVWLDANGTRQYSDRPPPPNTPASKILKAPNQAPQNFYDEPAAETLAPKATTAKPASTLAEREAAYQERVKARNEKNLEDSVAAQNQRAEAQRCANARQVQAQMASGMRIRQVGPDGQPQYMSDAERASRSAQAGEALRDCR